MQPSTSAILVIAGAVAVDCLWIAWESWREKQPPAYAGYTGPTGFVPRVHERPHSIVELLERLIMTKSVNITVNLNVVGWPITGTIQCEFLPCPPQSPIVRNVIGSKGQPTMITFTTTVSNVDPAATTVPYTASFDDGSPPQTFDVFLNQTFTTAGPGVIFTLVGTQQTPSGVSPPSVPVSFLSAVGVCLPIPPVVVLPAAPIVTQVTGV